MAQRNAIAWLARLLGLSQANTKKIVTLLLVLVFGAGGGSFMQGRVISVADGDTLTVLDGIGGTTRVRLYGIDCPESKQPGGPEAAALTRHLTLFKEVKLETVNKDRYGRAVAVVLLKDGTNVNETLVRRGHAWVYSAYCKTARCRQWKELEKKAKASRAGLWQQSNPMPPWKWRNG